MMNRASDFSFSGVLQLAREENFAGLSIAGMYRIIAAAGIDCSQRTFYGYYNGEYVPDVVVGRAILDELGLDYDDASFNSIIAASLIKKEKTSLKRRVVPTSITLDPNKLSSHGLGRGETERLLEERVRDVGGGSLSEYICFLIRKDLEAAIDSQERK